MATKATRVPTFLPGPLTFVRVRLILSPVAVMDTLEGSTQRRSSNLSEAQYFRSRSQE